MRRLGRTLRPRKSPLLVHCTHGKDRTGVLVALLLLALGASEEDVVADYVRSHDWGISSHGRHQMVRSFPERLRPHLRDGLIEEWCRAPESAIRTVLRRLESEHGSVEAYLDSIGVDAARRKRLAEALLTTEVCEVA
jgi:protein tyrosine/serine phosphatase